MCFCFCVLFSKCMQTNSLRASGISPKQKLRLGLLEHLHLLHELPLLLSSYALVVTDPGGPMGSGIPPSALTEALRASPWLILGLASPPPRVHVFGPL